MKRIFIAIELSKEIKDELNKIRDETLLRIKLRRARWVKPEYMHLTLMFLGDTEEAKIYKIEEICQKVAEKSKPFEISFSDLGGFPKSNRAHTLWADIKDSKELLNLQRDLSSEFKNAGFKIEERNFSPHLTLARLKKKENLKSEIAKFEGKSFGKMKVLEFYLFESQLTPEGPKHRIIKIFKLENKNEL